MPWASASSVTSEYGNFPLVWVITMAVRQCLVSQMWLGNWHYKGMLVLSRVKMNYDVACIFYPCLHSYLTFSHFSSLVCDPVVLHLSTIDSPDYTCHQRTPGTVVCLLISYSVDTKDSILDIEFGQYLFIILDFVSHLVCPVDSLLLTITPVSNSTSKWRVFFFM